MTKFEKISTRIEVLIDTIERQDPQTPVSYGVLMCLHDLDMECKLLELGKNLFDYEKMKKELEEKKNGKRD